MIKFIHRKHIDSDIKKGKIIIYYNITDIFLSIALFALVVFFINDYLSHSLIKYQNDSSIYSDSVSNTEENN